MTKKRILLVATGGTIASKEEGNGLSPALSGEELTRYVPEVADLATLDVVHVAVERRPDCPDCGTVAA